jgi:hypothetical protein
MRARGPITALWEFITTIATALAFTIIGLGTLIVIGLLLALPVVVILLVYQYLF